MIDPMIENLLDFAVVGLLGVATALACNRLLSAPKNKPENRRVGYRREEIQINAANVPEFEPTWQDMRGENETH
jgi:hypothetical protein